MKEYIFFFLRCLETGYGLLGLLLSLAKHRNNIVRRCAAFAVAIAAICGALTALYIHDQLAVNIVWLPLLLIVMLGGMVMLTADRWQVLTFNLFSQLSVYLLISFLPDMVSRLLLGRLVEPAYLLFRAVTFAIVIFGEVRFIRKPFRRIAEVAHREWNLAAIIAGWFLIMHFLLSTFPVIYNDRPEANYLLVCATYILMALVYYSLYIIVRNAVQQYEKAQVDAVMHLKLSSLERQLDLQKRAQEHIQRTRHDLRHYCIVGIGKIDSGDYTGAVEFLRQLSDHVAFYQIRQYSENNSINCVLSALVERAEDAGISVQIKVNVPDRLKAIPEVEMDALFANAFENAIEGCLRAGVEAPHISVFADYTDGRVLLSVKNPCGKVSFSEDLPVSTKPSGGTGTKSIQYIVEKYHGMVSFEVCDNTFLMRAYLFDQ